MKSTPGYQKSDSASKNTSTAPMFMFSCKMELSSSQSAPDRFAASGWVCGYSRKTDIAPPGRLRDGLRTSAKVFARARPDHRH